MVGEEEIDSCDGIKEEKVYYLLLEEAYMSDGEEGEVWLSFQRPVEALSGLLVVVVVVGFYLGLSLTVPRNPQS